MRAAHAQIDIADRRLVGTDNVNIHAQLIGMQPKRAFHALQSIERIKRWLGMQDHPPIGIQRIAARRQQGVNINLRYLLAAQFHANGGDIADQPACGKANPNIIDAQARDAFCLLHGFPNGFFGCVHIGDIATAHSLAFALTRAQHLNIPAFADFSDQRRDFPRPDIERRDQS